MSFDDIIESFDDIIESFSESFLVTKEANDMNRCHPKYNPYKCGNKSKEELQEQRRKEFFVNQKKNREQIVMRFRSLLDESDEAMDTRSDPKIIDKSKRFYLNKYKNQLMLSEWMVEMPEDLAKEWYLVLCPIGKRCLVISSRGQTKAYSRTGYLMNSFGSLLPGGNRKTLRDCKHNCIVDCIYSEIERQYYVLDVMSWNGSQFYSCDTEFRFFWLNSRLSTECLEVTQRSKLNPFPFTVLKHFGCTQTEIVSSLQQSSQFSSPLDGLLFFHKRSDYTPGVTPLVNWLKPDMLSDILGIQMK